MRDITIAKRPKQQLYNFLLGNYYYIIFSAYILSAVSNVFRVGIIASVIIIAILMLGIIRKSYIKVNNITIWGMCFLFWILFSFFWFQNFGLSNSVFIMALSNSMLPIIFTFLPYDNHNYFWRQFLNAYTIQGLIGLILLATRPNWYVRFCLLRGYDYRRLSAFVGSTIIGSMGAIALVVVIKLLIDSRGREGKKRFVFVLLFTFASMQRSAWFVAAVTMLIGHYLIFIKYRTLKLRYFFLEVLVVTFGFVIFRDQIVSLVKEWISAHKYVAGSNMVLEMFSSRVYTWKYGFEHTNLIIGSGFGSWGHKASYAGNKYAINDGSWANIICELGIVGLITFSLMIFFSIRKAWKNKGKLYLPLAVFLIMSAQAIGSNVFEMQLLLPILYISVGQVSGFRISKKIFAEG